jgi:hypothetical protein
VAPPTFTHTSTPAAEEAGNPRLLTIRGVHFAMK